MYLHRVKYTNTQNANILHISIDFFISITKILENRDMTKNYVLGYHRFDQSL